MVGHLVRRGLDAHQSYRAATASSQPDELNAFGIPTWGVIVLAITVVNFVLGLFAIEYTYGRVVTTLAMVESPTATLFESVSNGDLDAVDEKKDGDILVKEELVLVKEPMITSSLRKTIVHLRARAGYFSRFRGISAMSVHTILYTRLVAFFGMFNFIPCGVDAVLAAVVLARLHMAWTHIVITESSPKNWFQRVLDTKSFKKIAGPTAIYAICEQLAVGVPRHLFYAFGLGNFANPDAFSELDNGEAQLVALKMLTVSAVFLFLVVALVVPATVALTRVQASLLSAEEDTIVPVDRSFSGTFVPTAEGGSGVIGLRDAWKTFDWNSRVRLAKIYLKGLAMQLAMMVWFFVCITLQMKLILGADFKSANDIFRR